MTGVVQFNALWKQAFATALAPARKSSAATFCSHTRAKTVLAFTRSFRWLISAFHNREVGSASSESAYTRGAASIVNDSGGSNFQRRTISYEHGITAASLEGLIY